ncbi:Oligopeptide transport ATP-binding protein OppF [Planctomycetales bacterium 10988]|nr:Oligopeptide transport ATP-binding protein OppF [Planctomycetales bacterium 10988]
MVEESQEFLTETKKPLPRSAEKPILAVEDLKVHFPFTEGPIWNRQHKAVRAVDGISFSVEAGKTLGIVGESGCGKSTTARAILNLVPVTSGEVYFQSKPIAGLSERKMRKVRQSIQMIFQDPFASLNPRMTIGKILQEPMDIFSLGSRKDRKLEVMRLLDLVGLNPRFLNRFPHEFSGGQRQRIGIARALAVRPDLILCDEPVSALDVSIQAQILNLLAELREKFHLTYIFIAHDLAVVRHLCDRVAVMYLGNLAEVAPVKTLFEEPKHPYTQALLSAIPIPDPKKERQRKRILLEGDVPSPDEVPKGCPFAKRCPIAQEVCHEETPPLVGADHQVACFFAEESAELMAKKAAE